jgi:hypothetical protein
MPRTILLTLMNGDRTLDQSGLVEVDPTTIGEETMEGAIAMLRAAGGLVPGDVLMITEESDQETASAAR